MIDKKLLYNGDIFKLYQNDKIGNIEILGEGDNFNRVSSKYKNVKCKCTCGNLLEIGILTIKKAVFEKRHLKCIKCNNESKRKYNGREYIPSCYMKSLKRSADSRNIFYDITDKEVYIKYIEQSKKCALSGQIVHFKKYHLDREGTASVDRIDSSKGYTADNIQIIHKDINRMKNNFDNDYFIEICKMISKNIKNG